jgi:peptidyl-tRNA hydrolase
MYFVVNSNLLEHMTPGKIAGQVGHGTQYVMESYIFGTAPIEELKEYTKGGCAKIVLKAKENVLLKLHEQFKDISFLVYDAGKTQIPENSITVLAFRPLFDVPKELKRLSLL